MTGDTLTLYQELILDHYRRPRNLGALADGHQRADGNNPICGDHITVYVRLSQDVIVEATFEGTGCAICIASASLMTEVVRGQTIADADRLGHRVRDLVTAPPGASVELTGPLAALTGVRQFPVRAKCALLPWHTLHAAVHELDKIVSTE